MIHYTSIPIEVIAKGQNMIKAPVVMMIEGVPCEGRVRNDGTVELERLLSTNPMDYMKKSFAPGNILKI